jgi:hypothetical protein
MPRSKNANTPKRKRQWDDVERSVLARGGSPKIAAMSANAAVRDHPAKAKAKK